MLISDLKIHKTYVEKKVLIFIIIGIILNFGGFIFSELYIPGPNFQNKNHLIKYLTKKCCNQKNDIHTKSVDFDKQLLNMKNASLD